MELKKRNTRKKKIGFVLNNTMDKTIIISVHKTVKHKHYGKIILKKKKYFVHDEKNAADIGDKVKIMETRPISKKKCWRLVSIYKKK